MRRKDSALQMAALTHRGAVREHNEDTLAIDGTVLTGDLAETFAARLDAGRHALLLADGMGGHSRGELASRAAIEMLISKLGEIGDETACRSAIAAADRHLFALMGREPDAYGMGTTLVGAVIEPGRLVHFNIGDSRAYRCSGGRLAQLSHDDVPSPAGAGRGRLSHLLTQCLGGYPSPRRMEPHVAAAPALKTGEALLLCSDGLTDMADDEEIAAMLDGHADPAQAARALFELAMARGGLDNISVLIVRPATS